MVRLFAYLLAFVCGAAVMFAIDRASVKSNLGQPVFGRERDAPKQAVLPAVAYELDPAHSDDAPVIQDSTDTVADEILIALPSVPDVPERASQTDEELRLTGTTEPAPNRYAKLPLATNQAVAFVDVKPGDRVKKGWQVFSHWESPERLQAVQTELEKTKKLHEVAKSRWQAAVQTLERLQKLNGSVAAQSLQDAQNNVAIRQGEMEAAELAVAAAESHFVAMEFEFTQAFVTSPLDGIVASVDIHPGDRRQVGGPFRGVTVLDPRILNCRCFVNEEQLAQLQRWRLSPDSLANRSPDQSTDRSLDKQGIAARVVSGEREWPATIASIGILADERSGRIPILLEIPNADETLSCGVKVEVRFLKSSARP